MARHVTLDIRGMEPPEPLERVLGTIADFRAGDTLKVLSNFEPRPLYRILERDGFQHRVESGADAPFEITIWTNG
ncbi:MAG TPA: DUF2249 domain-containing protein [Casimicrobiaceae bacterium]|jgi:uncharacterized protein (DUF2249 family)|nr:DUF2249 domain-containing protein [Casimicrobiaceae bacterium]